MQLMDARTAKLLFSFFLLLLLTIFNFDAQAQDFKRLSKMDFAHKNAVSPKADFVLRN